VTRTGAVAVLRWAALAGWAAAFSIQVANHGVPYQRTDLLFWITLGLLAWSIGRRALWVVLLDFVPFAAVLIVYDHMRGIADNLGMPTWWHPQLSVDEAFFGGRVPTVWLQEHFKHDPQTRWWDVLAAATYLSFFFLPYLTAGVLWLRKRADFHRWAARFVTLSFVCFGLFALMPTAPPWAAAACTSAQVADHPSSPRCMWSGSRLDGGMLGAFTTYQPDSAPLVQRMPTRGLGVLHLHYAQAVIKTGQVSVDAVAAVPSLHAGGIMLFTIFFWSRVNRFWKALLALYNPVMAFALVYSAEHYVVDIVAGWLVAAGVAAGWTYLERRLAGKPAVDTLAVPSATS
jgi:membrane-associated phospholipid phosphatase